MQVHQEATAALLKRRTTGWFKLPESAEIDRGYRYGFEDARQSPRAGSGFRDFFFAPTSFPAGLDCHYEFDAGEDATYECPGVPDEVVVAKVYCRGADVTDLLAESVIEEIKDAIYVYLLDQREEFSGRRRYA